MTKQRFLTACLFHLENNFQEILTKTLIEKKIEQENVASQMDIVFVKKNKTTSIKYFFFKCRTTQMAAWKYIF